jgi:predicted dehydrogenase
MKNIIIYGGNFASKVIIKALKNHNFLINHFDTSKKRASINLLNNASYIFVAIPPYKNLDLFKELSLEKKKIFIEKPLSNNLKSAYDIKNICEKQNLEIFIDYTFNFMKIFQFLFNEIFINNEKILNYKFVWLTKTLQNNFTNGWKNDSSKGGGGLYNFISHLISLILNNFSDITSLTSRLNNKDFESYIFYEYAGVISIKHDDKVKGVISYDILSDQNEFSFEINTQKNRYKILSLEKDFFKHLKLFKNNKEIYNQYNDNDNDDSRLETVSECVSAFINSNSLSEKMDINHAIEVQEILHLIQTSHRKREEIFLNEIKN